MPARAASLGDPSRSTEGSFRSGGGKTAEKVCRTARRSARRGADLQFAQPDVQSHPHRMLQRRARYVPPWTDVPHRRSAVPVAHHPDDDRVKVSLLPSALRLLKSAKCLLRTAPQLFDLTDQLCRFATAREGAVQQVLDVLALSPQKLCDLVQISHLRPSGRARVLPRAASRREVSVVAGTAIALPSHPWSTFESALSGRH